MYVSHCYRKADGDVEDYSASVDSTSEIEHKDYCKYY